MSQPRIMNTNDAEDGNCEVVETRTYSKLGAGVTGVRYGKSR